MSSKARVLLDVNTSEIRGNNPIIEKYKTLTDPERCPSIRSQPSGNVPMFNLYIVS